MCGVHNDTAGLWHDLYSVLCTPHTYLTSQDKMSCCPPGALGKLGEQGYSPKGKVVRVEDLDIYVVGHGDNCVVWNYDIFGFDSGRTKQLADLLAESGFLVVMPDYFRGTFQVVWLRQSHKYWIHTCRTQPSQEQWSFSKEQLSGAL